MAGNKPRDEYDIPMEDAIGLDELLGPKASKSEEGKKQRRHVADKALDTLFDSVAAKLAPKKPAKREVDAFLEQAGRVDDLYERTTPRGKVDDFLSGKPVPAEDLYERTTPKGKVDDFLSGNAGVQEGPRARAGSEVFDLDIEDAGAARQQEPAAVYDLDTDAGDLSAWSQTDASSTVAPARTERSEGFDLDMETEVVDLGQFAADLGGPAGRRVRAPAPQPGAMEAPALEIDTDLGDAGLEVISGEDIADIALEIPSPRSARHLDPHKALEEEIFGAAPPQEVFSASLFGQSEDILYDLITPARAVGKRAAAAPVGPSGPETIQPRFDLDEFDSPLFPLTDDVTAYTASLSSIRHPVVPLVASPFDIVAEAALPPPEFIHAPFLPVASAVREGVQPEPAIEEQEGPGEPVLSPEVPDAISQDLLLEVLTGEESVLPPSATRMEEQAAYEMEQEKPAPEGTYVPAGTEAEVDLSAYTQLEEASTDGGVEVSEGLPEYEEFAAEAPAFEEQLAPGTDIIQPSLEAAVEPLEPSYEVTQLPEEVPVEEPSPVEEPAVSAEIGAISFVPMAVPLGFEPETGEAPPLEPDEPSWQPRAFRYTLAEFPSVEDVLPPLRIPRLSFELPQADPPGAQTTLSSLDRDLPEAGPESPPPGRSAVAVLDHPALEGPRVVESLPDEMDQWDQLDEKGSNMMTDMHSGQPQHLASPGVGPTLDAIATGNPASESRSSPEAGRPVVNEIAAIGHDLSTEEGITTANAALAAHLGLIGQKVRELRRIQDARTRMNLAYRQLNQATSQGAPLEQVVPLMKELQELKDSGTPTEYQAEQVADLLAKAEEARIIVQEYLHILQEMEHHVCCKKDEG